MKSPGLFEREKYLIFEIILIIAIAFFYAIFIPNLSINNPQLAAYLFWIVSIVVGIIIVLSLIKLVFSLKKKTKNTEK
jgi:uncharacterized membrane protein YwaF